MSTSSACARFNRPATAAVRAHSSCCRRCRDCARGWSTYLNRTGVRTTTEGLSTRICLQQNMIHALWRDAHRTRQTPAMDWTLEVVILPVRDLDAAVAFYRDKVGFHLDHRTTNE